MSNAEVARAARLLRAGELVAFPTETVYGLGADACNPAALAKVFAAKGRPADHPLIVHLPDPSHLERWARGIPEAARVLAEAFWPGPLTLILKRQPGVPDLVTGGQDTVGLRVPDHPVARELLSSFGGGIAAPSANRFGRISPTTAQHVRDELGDAVSLVLDGGPCAVGIESTIVDLSRGEPAILRPGMIGAERIEAALHRHVDTALARGDSAPRVSGSLDAHYAPRTPLRLVPAMALPSAIAQALAQGMRVAVISRETPPVPVLQWIPAAASADAYARDLYANLRALDAAGADLILVEAPPPAWLAVNDRLARAACGAGPG